MMDTTPKINFSQLNLLWIVDMVKDFVLATYLSMHNDTEKRMDTIEQIVEGTPLCNYNVERS